MTTTAYPLAWPQGWPRTRHPAKSRFKATLHSALEQVKKGLRHLRAKNVIFSSNVTLDRQRPADTGVAVYFTRDGRQMCIPCDAWNKVEDNLRAIGNTIEALRGIERWGAKHMVDAAFSGFVSLPPPKVTIADQRWHTVLGVSEACTFAQAERAYRDLARRFHPDVPGGSDKRMAAINVAYDHAREALDG